MPFSSMKRKIFSSTMMASSMTMPTISVSASIVIWFSVKPMAAISAKVEMIEVGMAMAAISVVRQLARKMKMMTEARMLPSIRWCWMELDGGFDEDRLIADDLRLDVFRERGADLRSAAPSRRRRSSTVFSPDCFDTTSVTAGTPSRRAAVRGSS